MADNNRANRLQLFREGLNQFNRGNIGFSGSSVSSELGDLEYKSPDYMNNLQDRTTELDKNPNLDIYSDSRDDISQESVFGSQTPQETRLSKIADQTAYEYSNYNTGSGNVESNVIENTEVDPTWWDTAKDLVSDNITVVDRFKTFKNMFSSLMAEKNSINNATLQGEVYKDINPKLDALDLIDNHLNTMKQLNALNEAYERDPMSVPNYFEEFNRLNNDYLISKAKAKDAVVYLKTGRQTDEDYSSPNYADNVLNTDQSNNRIYDYYPVYMNNRRVGTGKNTFSLDNTIYKEGYEQELQQQRESLLKQKESVLKDIATNSQDIIDWNEKITDDYRKKRGNTKNWLEYTMYELPALAGSSFSSWNHQAASIGSTILAGSALGAETPIGWGIGLLAAGASLYETREARREESLAEISEGYETRMRNFLASKGIDDSNLTPELYESLTGVHPSQLISQPKNSQELMSSLMMKEVPLLDQNFGQQLKTEENRYMPGMQTQYDLNMALGISDMAQLAINIMPIGRAVSAGLSMEKQAASNYLTSTSRNIINNVAETGLRHSNNKMMNLASSAIQNSAKGLVKGGKLYSKLPNVIQSAPGVAGKLLTTGFLEGVEEGNQFVYKQDFLSGKYDKDNIPYTDLIRDFVNSNVKVSKTILGIDADPLLNSSDEFWESVKGGFALGMGMSGGGSMVRAGVSKGFDIYNDSKMADASSFIQNSSLQQLNDQDLMNKSKLYISQLSKNNGKYIRETLNNLKENLPEGMTEEMIDKELEHFNNVENLYNNRNIEAIRKRNNWDKGSVQHGALIGLYDRWMNETSDIAKTLVSTNVELQENINNFDQASLENSFNKITSPLELTEDQTESLKANIYSIIANNSVSNERLNIYNSILELMNNSDKSLSELNKTYEKKYGVSLYEALGTTQEETSDKKNKIREFVNKKIKSINDNKKVSLDSLNLALDEAQGLGDLNAPHLSMKQFESYTRNEGLNDTVREPVIKNTLAAIRSEQLKDEYALNSENNFKDAVDKHISSINKFQEEEKVNNQREIEDYNNQFSQEADPTTNDVQEKTRTIPSKPINNNNNRETTVPDELPPAPANLVNDGNGNVTEFSPEKNEAKNNPIDLNNINLILPREMGQVTVSYNGEPVEFTDFRLVINQEDKTAFVAKIERGTNHIPGIGLAAYKVLGERLAQDGIKLVASDSLYADGHKLWMKLVSEGLAKRVNGYFEFVPSTVELRGTQVIEKDANKLDNKPNNDAAIEQSILAGVEDNFQFSDINDPYYEQESYNYEEMEDDYANVSIDENVPTEDETFVAESSSTFDYIEKIAREQFGVLEESIPEDTVEPSEMNGGTLSQLGLSSEAKSQISNLFGDARQILKDSQNNLTMGVDIVAAARISGKIAEVLAILFQEGVRNFRVVAEAIKENLRGATTDAKLANFTYDAYERFVRMAQIEGVDISELSSLEDARNILVELYPNENKVEPETVEQVIEEAIPIETPEATVRRLKQHIQSILNLIVLDNEQTFEPELFYRNPQEFQDFLRIAGINGTNEEFNNRLKNDKAFINNVEVSVFARDLAKSRYIADDPATWANNQYIVFIIKDKRDGKTFASTLIRESVFAQNIQESIDKGVFDSFIYNKSESVSAADILVYAKEAVRNQYKVAREAFNQAFEQNNPQNINDWRSYFNGNVKAYVDKVRTAVILKAANRNADNQLVKRNFNEVVGLSIRDLNNVTFGKEMTENQMPLFLAKVNDLGEVEIFDYNQLPVPHQSRMAYGAGLMYTGTNNRPEIAIDSPYIGEFEGLARLLYNLLVRQNDSDAVQAVNANGENLAFTPRQLINFIVGRKQNAVYEDLQKNNFWGFNVFELNGQKVYSIGKNLYNSNEILNESAVIQDIANSILFNKSQKHLFGPVPGQMDNDITMRNNELRNYNGQDIKLTDQLIIRKDDLNSGKTWLSWYMRNGVMKTALPDNPIEQVLQNNGNFIIRTDETTEAPIIRDIVQENPIIDSQSDIDPDSLLFGPTRVIANKNFVKGNMQQERKNLVRMLGNWALDNVEIVDDIITVAKQGIQAFGIMREDSIMLFSGAEEGTAYHEAFHRVSLLLIPRSQRESVYNSYRSNKPELANATNQEIEELLAEEFRNYVLLKSTTQPKIKAISWFNKIWNNIKAFIGINNAKIEKLFSDINNGKYANLIPKEENISEFRQTYGELVPFKYGNLEFKTIPTYSAFIKISRILTAQILANQELQLTEDGINQANGQLVSYDILNRIDFNSLKNALSNPKLLSHPTYGALYTEIVNNYDTFVEQMKRNLAIMNVKVHDQENNDPTIVEGEEEVRGYEKDSTEISVKNHAPIQIKFFVSTIEAKSFDGDLVITEKDKYTGLRDFYEFDEAWNKVISNISKYKSFEDMYNAIGTLAKRDPFFKSMQDKMDKYFEIRSNNQYAIENFKTNFYQTFSKFENHYVNLAIDRTGNVFLQDANFSRAERTIPIRWNVNFINDSSLFNLNENGELIPNKENINQIQKDYYDLRNEVTELIHGSNNVTAEQFQNLQLRLLIILKKLGVSLSTNPKDLSVLNELFISKYGSSYNGDPKEAINLDSLYQYLNSTTVGSIYNFIGKDLGNITKNGLKIGNEVRTLEDIFSRKQGFRELARVYAAIYPSKQEAMVNSADGGKRYIYSLPSFLNDQLFELNANIEGVLNKKSQVPYLKNSLILKSLFRNGQRTNNRLELKPFTSFVFNNTGDRGRDYTQISPLEDYITKLTAVAQDYFTTPVFADKKNCSFIKVNGLKLPHGVNLLTYNTSESGRITPIFSEQVVEIFSNYLLDEIKAIQQTHNLLQEIENETNPEVKKQLQNKLTKNYHKGKGTPKGIMFRYFKALTLNNQTESLNSILAKEGVDKGLEIIQKKYFNDVASRTEWVSNMLNDLIAEELKSAQKIGAIHSITDIVKEGVPNFSTLSYINPDTNMYTLPSNIILDLVKTLSDSHGTELVDGLATYQIIADYVVNNVISIQEFEKMFQGDPAFHANNDNKIKRLGILTSTGNTPRLDWPEGHRLHNITDYTVMEIKDSEVFSDYYQDIFDSVKRMFLLEADQVVDRDENMTDKQYEEAKEKYATEASEQATKVYKPNKDGSGNINQGDGGVYISPEMFRNLKQMDGEWNQQLEDAYQILISDQSWWLKADLTKKVMPLVMQPLKYVSYNTLYDSMNDDSLLEVPVADKMAMFTIWPGVATGDLRAIYDRMMDKKDPVHMVKFESAVKVGNRAQGNLYSNPEHTILNDLSLVPTYQQKYRQIRKQLLTDPHDTDDNSLGTQVIKAALSNIIQDRTYDDIVLNGKTYTGSELAQQVFDILNHLSNVGAQELYNEFGSFNDEGDFILNYEKLSNRLLEEAQSAGMSNNVIDGLTYNEETGKLRSPITAISEHNWLQSRIISMVNDKAINVHTAGGAAIQMSSFGLIDNIVSDGVGAKGRKINNGKKLKFLNPDGSMDAVVSINLFRGILPAEAYQGNGWSFEAKRNWLMDRNIISNPYDESHNNANVLPSILGYRIPTQGQSSLSALRVVDVLPENSGDTIILPDEFTALTGSDFDIDKLYFARHYYNEDGTRVKFVDYENNTSNKINVSNPIFNPDLAPDGQSRIISLNDEYIGEFAVLENENYINLTGSFGANTNIDEQYRGRGYGKQAYMVLANIAKSENKTLRSDSIQSIDAINLWESFVKDGYARKVTERIFDDADVTRSFYEIINDKLPNTFNNKLNNDVYSKNSREANVNRMLDIYMGLLTSKYHIHETRMPLDNPVSMLNAPTNSVLADIREFKGTSDSNLLSFEELTPHYQLDKKSNYFTGKTGLGPFALNNVHHVLTQLSNLSFVMDQEGIIGKYQLQNLSGIIGKDKYKTLDWLNAMISAHVDVAKDPYIIELGVNSYTYNMANLLLRTGKGSATFYFLSQDIIKDMSTAAQKAKGKFGQNSLQSMYSLQKEFVEEVMNDYNKRLELVINDVKESGLLTLEEIEKLENMNLESSAISKKLFQYNDKNKPNFLRQKLQDKFISDVEFNNLITKIKTGENLSEDESNSLLSIYRNNIEYLRDQIRIGKAYLEMEPFAGKLAELVSVSQVDTKKYGNNFITTKSFSNRVAKVLNENTFNNLDKLFNNTFIRTKLRNSVELIPRLCKDMTFLASEQFYTIHNMLLELTGNTYTRDEILAKNLANAIEGQVKTNFFNEYTKENNKSVYDMFFGQNSIPRRLGKIQIGILENKYPSLDGGSNLILNYIRPNLSDNISNADGLITEASSDNSVISKQDLTHAWDDLMNSEDTELSEFAKDLAIYAFYNSQDKPGRNTFFDLVPISFKEEIGFVNYMANQDSLFAEGMANVNINDIFLNNWWNDNIVPEFPKKNTRKLFNVLPTGPAIVPNTVIITKSKAINRTNRFGQLLYKPYYKIYNEHTKQTYLYYLTGTTIVNNTTSPVYQLITKRGYFDDKTRLFLYNNNIENNNIQNNRVGMYANSKIIEQDPKFGDKFDQYRSSFEYIFDIVPENVIIGIDKVDMNVISASEKASTIDSDNNRIEFTTSVSEEYNRNDVSIDENNIYIFEDNEDRGRINKEYTNVQAGSTRYGKLYSKPNRSGQGYGYSKSGNDSIRGLENAYELTVGERRVREGDNIIRRPWIDSEFTTFKAVIDTEIDNIKKAIVEGKGIKFMDNKELGDQLPVNLRNYLNTKLVEIGINNYGNSPSPIGGNIALISYMANKEFDRTNKEEVSKSKESSQIKTQNNIRKTYKGLIRSLSNNQIFVFGSNTQGRHGAGAAKTAVSFGAQYGNPKGIQGNTYALITKDLTKNVHPSIDQNSIIEQIQELYNYAENNPEKEFLVAYSGTGTNLNGYTNQQMADMFSSYSIPNNIVFEESFNKLLIDVNENTTTEVNETVQDTIEEPTVITEIQTRQFYGPKDHLGRPTKMRYYVDENLNYIRTEIFDNDKQKWYKSNTESDKVNFNYLQENYGVIDFLSLSSADMWSNFQNKIKSMYPSIRSFSEFSKIWDGFSTDDKRRMLKHLKLC